MDYTKLYVNFKDYRLVDLPISRISLVSTTLPTTHQYYIVNMDNIRKTDLIECDAEPIDGESYLFNSPYNNCDSASGGVGGTLYIYSGGTNISITSTTGTRTSTIKIYYAPVSVANT